MSDSPKLPPVIRIIIAIGIAMALFAVAMQIFPLPQEEVSVAPPAGEAEQTGLATVQHSHRTEAVRA